LERFQAPRPEKTLNGLRRFEEFYKKPIETLLELDDTELGHIIEKFYSYLKQNHPQNTCRNLVNCPIQYLKYFGKNPKYKKSLGIYTTTLTTRDHLLTVDEVREMWKVASLEEKVMLKTWMLGLRIGDASKIEWQRLNFKPSEEPQELILNTHKEGITAHAFVDSEFQKAQVANAPALTVLPPAICISAMEFSKRGYRLTLPSLSLTTKQPFSLPRKEPKLSRAIFTVLLFILPFSDRIEAILTFIGYFLPRKGLFFQNTTIETHLKALCVQ
jgi:hypothetical protein